MTVRIFVADPEIASGQLDAIRDDMPSDWELTSVPAGAIAILTQHVDITPEIVAATGGQSLLVGRLHPSTAAVTSPATVVLELPHPALISVAEHTIALMLTLSRHITRLAAQTAAQQWNPDLTPALTDQKQYAYNWVEQTDFGSIYGKIVGLVGLGTVGRAVAERLRPFGVHLLYTQRTRLPRAEEQGLGVAWREIDDLLRESAIVSLHHRFQEGSGGNDLQFDTAAFRLMKPTAYFVNTSRGRMVDEDALVRALASGELGGAALDVFRYEPLPPASPLLSYAGDNLILTPHVAGAPMDEAWQMTAHRFITALTAHLQDTSTGAASVI